MTQHPFKSRDPVRCERYFRNMRALGFVFEVDQAAGTVQTLMDGRPADPIIEKETQRRAWWLLKSQKSTNANVDSWEG